MFSTNTLSQIRNNPYPKIKIQDREFFIFPEIIDAYPDEDIYYNSYPDIQPYDVYKVHLKDTNANLDGKWVRFFNGDTSKIAMTFEVKNNILDGDIIEYFLEGNIRLTGTFTHGCRDKNWRHWNEKGILVEEENFTVTKELSGYFSRRTGRSSEYFENGVAHYIGFYNSKSEYDSLWVYYYPTGKIHHSINFKNNMRNGESLSYFENGNLFSSFTYENNYSKKKGILYYENGTISAMGHAFVDVKIGNWVSYYKNGYKKSEGRYKLHVTTLCMSSVPRDYYHSTKTGHWLYWHENGVIMSSGSYSSDIDTTTRGLVYRISKLDDWNFYDESGNNVEESYLVSKGLTNFNENDGFIEEKPKY